VPVTEPTSKTTISTNLGQIDAWSQLLDALLQGLGHALSNRIGALIAIADLAAEEGTSTTGLSKEIERLLELNRLLKLLPAESSARSEAILPTDVLSDALALMALHPHAPELTWYRRVSNTQPVRAPRNGLLRAQLLLLDAARAQAELTGVTTADVIIAGDESLLTISAYVEGGGALWPEGAGSSLRSSVAALGGVVAADGAGLVLHLPTLAALRRREEDRETLGRT